MNEKTKSDKRIEPMTLGKNVDLIKGRRSGYIVNVVKPRSPKESESWISSKVYGKGENAW